MADESVPAGGSVAGAGSGAVLLSRCFAWSSVAAMSAFLVNNYLTNWRSWPGASAVFGGPPAGQSYALGQAALYAVGVGLAIAYVLTSRAQPMRADALRIFGISAYIVRAAFWAVVLIGVADMVVSFLRVEGFLPQIVGGELTTDLGRSRFRGLYVHFPLVAIALAIAAFNRRICFHWLALLVVGAELFIVISRFIFSYEQAFMGDLVRFWYAALFLFASAHTLLEEGHVRVDVLYSLFSARARGIANAVGTLFLGMPLCWTILVLGMSSKSTVINSPLLSFEVTQTGFGMYVKYWMAGFLGIFAVTMLIQFCGYLLEAVADIRGEPGRRENAPDGAAAAAG